MSKKESAAVTSTRITMRGTIIVAVIGLISALVLGYWQFVLKPSGSNQAIETQYIGRVIDINTQQTIAGVKITLDLEGVPPIVYTDSEGVYRFKVVIETDISGQIRVDAQGYQIYTRNLILSPNVKNIEDIRLTPVTVPPSPTSTLVQIINPSAPETPTEVFSNAILVMNDYLSRINNAGNKDDFIKPWDTLTSRMQCNANDNCSLAHYQDWWWDWKVQYKLYDCGSNLVDTEIRYYGRDPITATTPTAPVIIRYQLVDDHGQLKINKGEFIEGPGADCVLEVSMP